MKKRYFTIEKAEGIIPELSSKIDRVKKLNQGIKVLEASQKLVEEDLHIEFEDQALMHFQSYTKLYKNLHKLYYEFYKELDEIESLGCILKGLEPALVDFLFKFEGRDVFLCWREGEEKIQHWHEIESGYDNRHPIFKIKEKEF
ncbi:MAG: DUF2203 domain-containing protein [Candidatus Nanoarchaeia archaeon]|nr:DUF2203 domain-containing protein [Candidatus Nanoarchaeia archaeon]